MERDDEAALYAALDIFEEIIDAPFFRGQLGQNEAKLRSLNAARRKRVRIRELEAELEALKAEPTKP